MTVHQGIVADDQSLSGMPADAVAALDRPDLRRPAADGREDLPVAASASAEPAPPTSQQLLAVRGPIVGLLPP